MRPEYLTRSVLDSQVGQAALLQLAEHMFPEGREGPRAAQKGGTAAPLINALLINSKDAVDALWEQRAYESMKPDEIKERLGYRLDREEARAYVRTGALHKPLISPIEARYIGKRVGNAVGASGDIGKPLAKLIKNGASTTALLQAKSKTSASRPQSQRRGRLRRRLHRRRRHRRHSSRCNQCHRNSRRRPLCCRRAPRWNPCALASRRSTTPFALTWQRLRFTLCTTICSTQMSSRTARAR